MESRVFRFRSTEIEKIRQLEIVLSKVIQHFIVDTTIVYCIIEMGRTLHNDLLYIKNAINQSLLKVSQYERKKVNTMKLVSDEISMLKQIDEIESFVNLAEF